MRESDFPLFPERASTAAGPIDALYFYLVAVTAVFTILIFGLIVVFAVKYRRRRPDQRADHVPTDLRLEFVWMAVPFALTMVMFVWGADVFHGVYRPPSDALDVYVVGKQWMWKVQHPDGRREINELHVPVGRPVRLTLTSEDVIHSFYVPAFRLKRDVLPGRYGTFWFQATRPGSYHLFCAEYCGTLHSGMAGRVVVLEARDYERWLAGGADGESLASGGERLFLRLGCAPCHNPDPAARGPRLEGLWGKRVTLEGGGEVLADENYLRESILDPQKKVVAGYAPVMPAYRGQVGEEGLLQLLDYLKSIGRGRPE